MSSPRDSKNVVWVTPQEIDHARIQREIQERLSRGLLCWPFPSDVFSPKKGVKK